MIIQFQQQLAGMVVLIMVHFWQITSVSLQLSIQQGIQNNTPVTQSKKQHQAKVTPPILVLITLSVYCLHISHLDILPICVIFVIVAYLGAPLFIMIVWGGGGGGW